MKTLKLTLCFLFSMVAFYSFASNPIVLKTDTLKKTDQYILLSKTPKISDVFFTKNKKSKDQVLYIKIGFAKVESNSNAIKTAVMQGDKQYGENALPTISDVKILKGKYEDMKAESASKTASLYTLSKVEFPLHLQVFFMGEMIDFELIEAGKWDIDLNLKK